MKRYIIAVLLLLGVLYGFSQGKGPQIGTYPPQVHQQICQESTFTRYLDVFNSGDTILVYNASLSIDTLNWVSATPLSGEIQPGDTIQIRFDFNSAGLPINNYYADLVINSNDPDEPVHTVLAMLHVQILTIYLESEADSICYGCSTKLNVITFGCSEEYSYNWTSEPPGFFSTEKSPVVSPQVNTTYTVTVTDGNYSSQKSVYIQVAESSGLLDNLGIYGISFYPNPGHDLIKLTFNSAFKGQGIISINDLSGLLVHIEDVNIENGMNEFSIKMDDINPGVYLMSVQAKSKKRSTLMFTEQIVVY